MTVVCSVRLFRPAPKCTGNELWVIGALFYEGFDTYAIAKMMRRHESAVANSLDLARSTYRADLEAS